MDKPIYKYATLWGVLGGTALAFLYLKTLGKDKNLALTKTLLIGGAIGGGLGLGIDLSISRKPKAITEESLRALAKSISTDAESQVDNYLLLMKKAKQSDADNQRIMNVINGQLLAMKDNKWDAKADIKTKKAILLTYGVTEQDFGVFQDIIVKGLADILSGIFPKTDNQPTQ
jgi:hypothetical protein